MSIRFIPPTYLAPSGRYAPDFLWAVSASGAVNYTPRFATASTSTKIAGGRAGLEGRGDFTNALWSSGSALTTSDGTGSGDFTLLVLSNVFADATRYALIAQREGTTFAQAALYANADATGAASSGSLTFFTLAGSTSAVASAGALDGQYHVFAGRRSGTAHSLWKDGFSLTSSALTVRDVHTAAQRLAVGGGWTNSGWAFPAFTSIGFQLSAGWNRALTDGELLELGRNPWLLFNEPRQPLRRAWSFTASAASPVTGSFSVTESSDTAALAASVLVQGSFAVTESADTAALAASVIVTGSLAATESPDTAAFAGWLERLLSFDITEPPDTAAFVVDTGAPEVVDQPSGGWGAFNALDAERQRRRQRYLQELEDAAEDEREREALADRLEQTLVAEGSLDPVDADLLRLRGMAAQYADDLPNRVSRALAYAERAQTAVATAMALKELERLRDEEEYAVLLTIALDD